MTVREAAREALLELCREAHLGPGTLVVVGASTSEVAGMPIGKASSLEVAVELLTGLEEAEKESHVRLVFQCCEHLNRAIVLPREILLEQRRQEVSAFPVPGAGGALACAALLTHPDRSLAETVSADAGLDIGQTLIGMHIRPVVKPLRLSVRQVGEAAVSAGYSRPKLIGGARAAQERPEGLVLP